MNTGQTMITFGAMILLTIVILNMNRTISNGEDYLNQTRFGLEAIAITTSMIEEISQLPFDEESLDTMKVEKVVTDFTYANSLGPDAGETGPYYFDDVDDFKNFTKAETTQQNIYQVFCDVNYVTEANPGVPVNTRTFFKKISISVVTPLYNDTTTMDYIHGFWYFN